MKILYWDRDGFAIWAKRLEEGAYAMPFGEDASEARREITAPELIALLSGIDLNAAQRRKRYRRKCVQDAVAALRRRAGAGQRHIKRH